MTNHLINNIFSKLDISEKQSGSAIGTKWLSQGTKELKSFSPINEQLLGSVTETTYEELQSIITKSNEAFMKWREVPAPKRGELVRLIGNKLREYKKELGLLVSLEMGKSLKEGEGEVQEMIDMADFAVGQSRMLYGNTMHSERESHRMYEQWHPLGIVGVISAFNFPVAVWAWNAFIAAICGDVVIWKPSDKTPLSAVAVHKICAKIFAEHNYPDVFSLFISSDVKLSETFIDDKRISLVSFTGSTKVGRIVNSRLASRFAKVIMELGGNNATIITNETNLTTAIPAIVFAAIGTCGQRCTTLRRLIVHESIIDNVSQSLVNAYKQLKIGDPTLDENHMGPLIDNTAVDNYFKAIKRAEELGAKVLYGNKRIDAAGFYVLPTIIRAKPDWDIVNEETFAPILYVIPYKDIEEAIAINNQVDYGLSSAIFTHNILTAEKFLSASGSDCGIANVNIGTSGAEIGGAFGGEKDTGGGREAGSDSWKAYMRRQTNTINYGDKLTLAQGIQFDLSI